jgi:DNA repair protein RadD
MTIKLRDYQQPVKDAVLDAWTRVNAVLAVMATGAGKTVVFSSIISDHVGASAAVVHRKEILAQISCSIAMLGVRHRVIAPAKTIKMIRRKHLERFGSSFVDPDAPCGVASVQTLTSRSAANNPALQRWLKQVTLCVFDEGHHYVKAGLWARAVEGMVNAKLLQVTACPERADGQGLGVDADGFAQELVEGPQVKWLIDQGYLTPFKYYAPNSDINLQDLAVTASGDFNAKAFRARVVESQLVGDTIAHYNQFAAGKRAIIFATDVETSNEIAARFGKSAISLDGATDDGIRERASSQFERGEILQLVNVDLFDEGYDVPAAECAILDRPTQSLNKFLQMIGRVLRVVYAEGYDISTADGRKAAIAAGPKPHAIIIDPVRNWERHGMPDWPRQWTLQGRDKSERGKSDTMPQRVCLECTMPYEAYHTACPYCGAVPVPPERTGPEHVDGDLSELDTDAMAALFDKMNKANMPDEEYQQSQIQRRIPPIGRNQDLKRFREAKARREVLRHQVGWWVGAQEQAGRSMPEIHKRFYLRFGVDIVTAFSLNANETQALLDKITAKFALDTVG